MGNITDIGSPVTEFVKSTVEQIKAGLPQGFMVRGDIEFELSVISGDKVGGGLQLQVLKFGGEVKNEQVQKVKFAVTDKPPVTLEQFKQFRKNM